jgi:DNA-binding CsgD family transcriptional regulator
MSQAYAEREAGGAVARTEPGLTAGLAEREHELEQLDRALARARDGDGALVVIEGPAGIGKSALLDAAATIAQRAGMRLLRGRASELEREFPFAVALSLFERLLADAGEGRRAALFDGAAGFARGLFEPRAQSARSGALPGRDRAFATVHGLYWLTANVAERGSLAVAIDDAHWADPPSLRYLAYLCARLEGLPVAVLAAIRSGEPAVQGELVAALRGAPGALVLTPRPLSPSAVATVVRAAVGPGAESEFCAACARVSAGNPFLLRELVAELAGEAIAPVAANATRVEGVHPATVRRAVLARLARLGEQAGALARALAVLDTAPLRLATALAGLEEEQARAAADRLIAAEILAAGPPLSFAHPLLRRSVYESIPPVSRGDAHRRAGLLLADGEEASPALVGAHLLRSEPSGDRRVAALLADAGHRTRTEGAPALAISLLRRALAEPPPSELRADVLGELGAAEAEAHEPAAVEHLRAALELVGEPAARVRLACALADALVWRGEAVEGHKVLERALTELPADADPGSRIALETMWATLAALDKRLVTRLEARLDELHELALASGPAGRPLLISEACFRAQRGRHDGPWRELLDRGLDGGRFIAEHTASAPVVVYGAAVLALADEPARAERLLADIRADARARGSLYAHLNALTWGALLAVRGGRPGDAEADARAALELASGHGVRWALTWAAAILAQALLERGALEEAERTLAGSQIDAVRTTSAELHGLLARGRLRLAQGRLEEAVADLTAAGEASIVDNPSFVPWRSTLAFALHAADPARARSLARAELERADELGQPRGIGVALRAVGVLGGGEEGIDALKQAVATLRASPARLELARTLCELGGALRRARRRAEAREALREALALAERAGADALAERARGELLAAGARPRRERIAGAEALTASERRVAELAAAGMSNREIAQALFITAKTVQTHLGHIYRKLDLSGPRAREGIAARLGTASGA